MPIKGFIEYLACIEGLVNLGNLFQMKSLSRLLATVAVSASLVSSPALAETYVTGSIGASKIGDIDVVGSGSDITFESGLGLDLGVGYDFGNVRLEGSWVRGQSDKTAWSGNTIKVDSTIDSLLGSVYYDFRDTKTWSPFIGASVGVSTVDVNAVTDSGATYGLAYGLSYKTSDTTDVFFKGQTLVVPEMTFGSIVIMNGNYSNGTIGVRHRF